MALRNLGVRGFSELNAEEQVEMLCRMDRLVASGRVKVARPYDERFPPVPRPGETIQWNSKVLVGEPLPDRPKGILDREWRKLSAIWRREN